MKTDSVKWVVALLKGEKGRKPTVTFYILQDSPSKLSCISWWKIGSTCCIRRHVHCRISAFSFNFVFFHFDEVSKQINGRHCHKQNKAGEISWHLLNQTRHCVLYLNIIKLMQHSLKMIKINIFILFNNFIRLDHCLFMADGRKIRQSPRRSTSGGPTEWEVILAEMKAQLYMYCGTLLIRLAKEVFQASSKSAFEVSRS